MNKKNNAMKKINIGDWVTQYRTGYWKVKELHPTFKFNMEMSTCDLSLCQHVTKAVMRKIEKYFKEHPDNVIIQKLKDDGLHRRNVFALLRGEKDDNRNTIIFHGHTDTVGVEDYGELKQYAFDTDRLKQELLKINLPEDVRSDLESGDYLFGRGACDMKSGDAVFMVIIKHIAEHIKEFSGNILLSLNPVEENLHTGIIEGIDVLEQIKSEFGLRYVLAINND